MATANDAELILKLYDLRREPTLRKAREWLLVEFEPQTMEDIHIAVGGLGSQKNQFWRQVTSYWEMAASLVLRGALDPDLFLDSNPEGFALLAKFDRFREEYQKTTNQPFMPKTAALVEKYPAAREHFERIRRHLDERRAGR
jgi:hypothetical protein